MSGPYRDETDHEADRLSQFTPAPAVDVSPTWPPTINQEREAAGIPPAPAFYETSTGLTITECAVCLIDVDADDPTDRPFRAITAIEGTPVCREHLVPLDRAAAIPMPGINDNPPGIVELASHLASGVIK